MPTKHQSCEHRSSALLFCSLLLSAQTVCAAPVSLADSDMHQVTAGNSPQAGGIVVGNHSNGNITQTTTLTLSDEVQAGAAGLNITNTSNSAVANTGNIWDGKVVTIGAEGTDSSPVLEINQVNQITQESRHGAIVSGYSRPQGEQTEITRNSSTNATAVDVVDTHNVTNTLEEARFTSTISSSDVNTLTKFNIGDKLYFEGNLGQGVAVAGHADISMDGGSSDIALVAGGGISVNAGLGTGPDDLEIIGLNFGDTEASAGIDISAGISLIAHQDLPAMQIVIDGAGCGVVLGSCNASSIVSEYVETKADNSTLDIVENHQAGQSAFSEEHIAINRSSFVLGKAEADYVIVDDSSLVLDSEVSLELSDSAQKDIEGMNVVNAISSNVANSTNISRASQFETRRSTLVLNQMNIVHHGN